MAIKNRTYVNHKPSAETLPHIENLRIAADSFHQLIEASVPNSRERSLAFTKLEECLMWAVKGVVLNDPNSTPEPPKG